MTTDQYDSLSPTNRERVESRCSTTPQQSALLATRCRDRIQLKLRTARVIHSQYCTHAPRVFTSQIHPADSERIKHYFCKAVQQREREAVDFFLLFFLGGGGGGDAKERKRFYINTRSRYNDWNMKPYRSATRRSTRMCGRMCGRGACQCLKRFIKKGCRIAGKIPPVVCLNTVTVSRLYIYIYIYKQSKKKKKNPTPRD